MIQQTSTPGVFSVLYTGLPNASRSKEWKAMKDCSERTKKSVESAQSCWLFCAPLHHHRHSVAEPESSHHAEQVSKIWEGMRKAGTEKSTTRLPTPQQQFLLPAIAREPPRNATFTVRWISLQTAFGRSVVTEVHYNYGLTSPLGHDLCWVFWHFSSLFGNR